jgi:hypothetical protein
MKFIVETSYKNNGIFEPGIRVFEPGWWGHVPYFDLSAPYFDGHMNRQHVKLTIRDGSFDKRADGQHIANGLVPEGYMLVRKDVYFAAKAE